MRDAKVWIRIGDNDDYHDFDSPYDAGYEIGSIVGSSEPIELPTIARWFLTLSSWMALLDRISWEYSNGNKEDYERLVNTHLQWMDFEEETGIHI